MVVTIEVVLTEKEIITEVVINIDSLPNKNPAVAGFFYSGFPNVLYKLR